MGNAKLVDTMVNDALWDAFNDYHMIKTADNICEEWGLTREELDEFALKSQLKACAAQENGAFDKEIVPVMVKKKKKQSNSRRMKVQEPVLQSKVLQNFVRSIRADSLQPVMHPVSMMVQQQSLL